MKRFSILLSFVFLFFGGCTTHYDQNMSYNKAQNIINTNIQNLGSIIAGAGFSGTLFKQYSFDIYSQNIDFDLQANLQQNGEYNNIENSSQTQSSINVNFLDKNTDTNYIFSGELYNVLLKNFLYTKVGDFYINIGSGNYQNKLINSIISKIRNKRIRSDNPLYTLQNKQKNIVYIYNQILSLGGSGGVFDVLDKISYDGNLAYKVNLKSGFVQDIKNNTNISIKNFEGLLIVNSSSDVVLKIVNMYIVGDQPINIEGYIAANNGKIKFTKPDNLYEAIILQRKKDKKGISFSLKKLKNMQQLWGVYMVLSTKGNFNEDTENKIIQVNGLISISPLLIYGSNLEKNIEINITGQYKISNIIDLKIVQPDSYILLDQILGDSFSLKTLHLDKISK